MTLLEMSRKLKIPVSTLFDTVKEVEKSFQFTIVLKDNKRNVSLRDTILVVSSCQVMDTGEEEFLHTEQRT
jgi:hypothetical protein